MKHGGRHYPKSDNKNMHGKGDDGYHCEQKGAGDAVMKGDGDGYLKKTPGPNGGKSKGMDYDY